MVRIFEVKLQNNLSLLYKMSFEEMLKDVYVGNRMLVDFPDDVIDILESSDEYEHLFTPALSENLYREKTKRVLSKEAFEAAERNTSSWRDKYIVIRIVKSRETDPLETLLTDIVKDQDSELLFFFFDMSRLFQTRMHRTMLNRLIIDYHAVDLFRDIILSPYFSQLEFPQVGYMLVDLDDVVLTKLAIEEMTKIISERRNITDARATVMAYILSAIDDSPNSGIEIREYLRDLGYDFDDEN